MSDVKQVITTKQDGTCGATKSLVDLPSLRDKVAMAAMPSLIIKYPHFSPEDIAFSAYKFADAMMEARK